MGTDNQNSQEDATTTTEDKTFTQAEVNSFLKKEKEKLLAKYEGFEDFKAKAEKLDEIEAANKTELEKANEEVEKLRKQLDEIKTAETVRAVRENVAKETGIPAHLLTGKTKEECEAQAAAIADFAKPAPYPTVKDGGEINNIGKSTTRQQFADWTEKVF